MEAPSSIVISRVRDTAVRVLAQIVRRVLHGVEQRHDFDLERVADKLVQRPAGAARRAPVPHS
jgi:hypothetical protein